MAVTTLFPAFSVLLGVTSNLVMGQLPSFGAWGFGHGAGPGAGHGGYGLAPSGRQTGVLTCAAQLEDGRELKITISERAHEGGGMYSALGGSPHLALSPTFAALAGLGGQWGMGQGGLDMDIHVRLLRDIPSASFAFTQFASSSPASCPAEGLGQIITPSGHGGQGHAGMGLMASPLLGGFGHPLVGGSLHEHGSSPPPPGVIATTPVKAGTAQILKITQVQGFHLDQLAGRGFMVCDDISLDWNWQPVCNTPMLDVCCGLTYSSGALPTGGYEDPYPAGAFSPVNPIVTPGFGVPVY